MSSFDSCSFRIVGGLAFAACAAILLGKSLGPTGSQQLQVPADFFVPENWEISQIIGNCGELCSASGGIRTHGKFFDERAVNVDCAKLFSDKVFVQHGHGEERAPHTLPAPWLNEYTLNGKSSTREKLYFDQKYLEANAKVSMWSVKLIDGMIAEAKAGTLRGSYSTETTRALLEALDHAPGVAGGSVLVIGSENPWVEACALASGARHVTTLEYGSITSMHPNVSTILPHEYRKYWATMPRFDAVLSFSSVEHSGLGRYGDALNPWGDVLEVGRAWCVSKPGASLTIAVPFGKDSIVWNAHRVYGKHRYPYLASNWHQLWRQTNCNYHTSCDQPIHIFKKR